MTGSLHPSRPGVTAGLSRRRVLTRAGLVVAGALGGLHRDFSADRFKAAA